MPQWINVLIVQCSIINHVVYLFHEGKTRMFQIHLKSFHERTKSDTKKWISITFTLPKWKKDTYPCRVFHKEKLSNCKFKFDVFFTKEKTKKSCCKVLSFKKIDFNWNAQALLHHFWKNTLLGKDVWVTYYRFINLYTAI